MGLITKLFGSYSDREIKRILPVVDRIEALDSEYAALTDEQLKGKTAEFKTRLEQGETLDELLPVKHLQRCGRRPARVLWHDSTFAGVQLIGGIVLHQGRIAEMKTGEGKTLVATLPSYLNALAGKGVHIVTVNDYLAKRDSESMEKVHNLPGAVRRPHYARPNAGGAPRGLQLRHHLCYQ